MKLASLKNGRDGKLVVVSNDLAWYASADMIAPTLQAALDNWDRVEADLRNLATDLDHEVIPRERFHERLAAAPLPRAYQWADGSAYVNHVALVRQARGAEMPESFWHDPLMYQGGSDGFLGPRDPIPLADEAWGCDLEGEVVVVTGDVPLGASREEALAAIRLVGLTNDVSLRNLIPGELAKGFGFFQSKPASAFSPVFATPDSLGDWWQDGKLHRRLMVDVNGKPFGRAEAGVDMTFDFGTLVAHAAKTRKLGAGTIIGSGTVSNRGADGGPGTPVGEGGVGYSCIAEIRTIETIRGGAPVTPFLKAGDTVRIWAEDDRHHPIFGVIEQTVGGQVANPARPPDLRVMTMENGYSVFETAAGFAAIGWNARGIRSFRLPPGTAREAERSLLRRLPDAKAVPPPPQVQAVIDDARRYFAGERVDFAGVAVDLGRQEPFFDRVYAHVRQLGWGETATYGAIARALDAGPEFARDVGQAMAANPVPLIIPCHRVTAANGRIGGFSAPGGSLSKAHMLALEGVEVQDGIVTRDMPQLGLGF